MNVRFAQVTLSRFFATGASVVSGLVVLRLLPHYLTETSFGVVNLALLVLTYLPLLDGGFRLVLNRELLAGSVEGRLEILRFGQCLANRLTLVALVAGPLLTVAYSFAPAARESQLPVSFFIAVGASAALTFASSMQVLTLVGLDRQGLMSAIQGGGSLMNVSILWMALHGHYGVWAFPLGQATAAVGMWSMSAWSLRQLSPTTPILNLAWDAGCRRLWNTYKGRAWAVFRMQFFIVLLLSLDLFLAGWITRQQLGAYGIMARVLGVGRGLLTALGEASWPRIARGDTDPAELTRRILSLNAWCYGALSGVLLGAAPEVLAWYVHAGWTPAPVLLWLLVARFHVIGLTSPASYNLIGSGDYKTMVRCVGLELVLGALGGLVAGWRYGAAGVAASFLVATAAGTLFPILAAYARRHQLSPWGVFSGIWMRSLAAGSLAFLCSHFLVGRGWQGPASLAASAVGGIAALSLGLGFAWWHGRKFSPLRPWMRLWAGA